MLPCPCDCNTFAHPFTLRWCLTLKLRCLSCWQQIDGPCLFIHLVTQWILSESLSLLICKVITEMCVLDMVVMLLMLGVVCILRGIVCFHIYGFIFLSKASLVSPFLSSAPNNASHTFFRFALLDIQSSLLPQSIMTDRFAAYYYFRMAVTVF